MPLGIEPARFGATGGGAWSALACELPSLSGGIDRTVVGYFQGPRRPWSAWSCVRLERASDPPSNYDGYTRCGATGSGVCRNVGRTNVLYIVIILICNYVKT